MIEIDSFTGLEQSRQASDIRQLVKREKRWLKAVRPETFRRHRSLRKSIETLGRAAVDNDISVHIIRRDAVAVGLATIVGSLNLWHPTEREHFGGRQIDYWTQTDVDDAEHREIALSLAGLHGYEGTVLGLLTPAEKERAQGIPLTMRAVGRPSWMEIPAGEDRFGISRIPDLQLYLTEV